MPVGTGSQVMSTIPAQPFVPDPNQFFQMTSKTVLTPRVPPIPGPGMPVGLQLLQAGIVSKLQIVFQGTIDIPDNAVTSALNWPYGLLSRFRLSANGQNDLFSCDGVDLHVLRYLSNPAFVDFTDNFVGDVGAAHTFTDPLTNSPLYLTWDVPIAADQTSLIGALYAQSSATNLTAELTQARNEDLFTTGAGSVSIEGSFFLQETLFQVPTDAQGNLVTPDLSRLHGFQSLDVPISNVGETRVPLIRSSGQLMRLLIRARNGTSPLSALPSTAAAAKIDGLRLEYGGNQRPYTFQPAGQLVALNNQHYGAPLPYDYLCVDFVKENAIRDAVYLQGVTELAAIVDLNDAVTPSNAVARVIQETLF